MRADIGPTLGVLLLLVAGCAGGTVQTEPPTQRAIEAPASGISQQDIAREAVRLHAALQQEVPQHTTDTTAGDLAWISRAKAAVAAAPLAIEQPQLLVVVDRNPAVQELRIILAQPNESWQVIGGSKVSTGQSGRRGYFITPVGVFLHTDGILDYRALGTYNENHIRGLGLKGMRVWDFGWQTAERGWRDEPDPAEIRCRCMPPIPTISSNGSGNPLRRAVFGYRPR